MKLELFRPTEQFYINQHFGQSESCVFSNYPQNTTVVSKTGGVCPTGFVELYPLLGLKGHNGLDCYAPTGTPLYACRDGNVIEVSSEPERGIGLDVVTTNTWDLDGRQVYIKWRYWHLKDVNVKVGDTVRTGDLVGHADNTGLSSGSHLHWECKIVYWNGTKWINKFPDNGYFGAFDFEQWISSLPALELKLKLENLTAQVGLLTKLFNFLFKRG